MTTTTEPSPGTFSRLVSTLVGHPAFWVVTIGLIFGLPILRATRTPLPELPPVYGTVPPFELTDQLGRPFGSEQLVDRVWAANFIFTRCPSICPMLTERGFEIQHRSRGLGNRFHQVSFTVDPEHDTPEVLSAYAQEHRASPRAWSFLTGEQAEIHATVVKGLKVAMGERDPADPAHLTHSPHFVLVDHEMQIRGYYDANDEGAVDALLRDAGILCNLGDPGPRGRGPKPPRVRNRPDMSLLESLPAINASFNGLSASFVLAGWWAVRTGRVEVHKKLMACALIASTLFLVGYLTRVSLSGVTEFRGEGLIRSFYLALLFSHMILAMAVVPLVLRTVYLAVRDRIDAHKRLVRFTLPVWLYVSFTGVAVYVMLYHVSPRIGAVAH